MEAGLPANKLSIFRVMPDSKREPIALKKVRSWSFEGLVEVEMDNLPCEIPCNEVQMNGWGPTSRTTSIVLSVVKVLTASENLTGSRACSTYDNAHINNKSISTKQVMLAQ